MLILLLVCLSLSQTDASEDWWEISRLEDEKYIFYVASAEGVGPASALQSIAFNKALVELIREHFGMNIQVNESMLEELNKNELQIMTRQHSKPLYLRGIAIEKVKEVDIDDEKRVFVKIRATKAELMKSYELLNRGEDLFNTYGDDLSSRVRFKVKTNPEKAFIQLTHMDQRFSIQGEGNAMFYLPLGRYKLVVQKDGFQTLEEEILVQTDELIRLIHLQEKKIQLELITYPSDAKVQIGGEEIFNGVYSFSLNKSYPVQISHPDYYDSREVVQITNPEQETLSFHLRPKDSSLIFNVHPSDSIIEIDGKEYRSQKKKIVVAPGRKKVKISSKGYETFEDEIEVVPNRDYPLREMTLKKQISFPVSKKLKINYENSDWGGRFEYNFLQSYHHQFVLMEIPIAFHVKYSFLSLGVGYSRAKDSKGGKEASYRRDYKLIDTYSTLRSYFFDSELLDFYGAYSVGEFSFTKNYEDDYELKKSSLYMGPGLGLKLKIYDSISIHGEAHHLKQNVKGTDIKRSETKFLIGLGFDF